MTQKWSPVFKPVVIDILLQKSNNILLCLPLCHFLSILFPEQRSLSVREWTEIYQDALGIPFRFEPGSYCYLLFL